MEHHVPVLVAEIVEALVRGPGGLFVDLTLGDGGHTEAILRASDPDGCVVAFDVDAHAIERARERLHPYRDRISLVHGSYTSVAAVLESQGMTAVDGIVVDFGFSRMQIETPERGFSFQRPGPLDMRMDPRQPMTAEALVAEAGEQELAHWFHHYGEERFAKRVARTICEARVTAPIETTAQLAAIVRRCIPRSGGARRIDPSTRVFQALRIVVNGELANVERILETAPRLLRAGGRFAALSYHSLEDRLVKQHFRRLSADDAAFHLVTKRPLRPSVGEARRNARARSAKLRILERS